MSQLVDDTRSRADRVSQARSARAGWVPPAVGIVAVAGAFFLGVLVGPAGIDPAAAIGALLDKLPLVEVHHGLTGVEQRILFDIRLPRVVLGGIVGGVLALAGSSYQGVFRNPLADPYLLGVAAGAGLGATIAFAVSESDALVAPLAFAGGLLAVMLSYGLGRSVGGRSTVSLILAGVAVAAFATAMQTFLLQRNVETVREVYSWILGRLVTVGWDAVIGLLPYAVVAGSVLVGARRLLDVLSLGDEEAQALGVNVRRVRWVVVVAATVVTAATVSVSGLIGFVGIIVPHTVRMVFGWSYRVIVVLSIFFGAAFLMLADVAARTLVAPGELPIGVVTAFLGAPFFLLVLRTMRSTG